MKVLQWFACSARHRRSGLLRRKRGPTPIWPGNLAATCANCHGTNGWQPGAGNEEPAGIPADKLLQKLRDLPGAKPATIMHQISKGYTEAQLRTRRGISPLKSERGQPC